MLISEKVACSDGILLSLVGDVYFESIDSGGEQPSGDSNHPIKRVPYKI